MAWAHNDVNWAELRTSTLKTVIADKVFNDKCTTYIHRYFNSVAQIRQVFTFVIW